MYMQQIRWVKGRKVTVLAGTGVALAIFAWGARSSSKPYLHPWGLPGQMENQYGAGMQAAQVNNKQLRSRPRGLGV